MTLLPVCAGVLDAVEGVEHNNTPSFVGIACRRCSAALDALNQAHGLSNVQSGDSYLCALMAAADGTLVLPDHHHQQQQQQQQQGGASAAGKEPLTPRDVQLAQSR
jgi:hypothetical protein